MRKATLSAIPIRPATSARLEPRGKEGCHGRWSRFALAQWIWNIADQHFPGAIQIVDLYHARQHLWELARKLYPNQEAEQERWILIHKDALLDEGKIEDLVAS